MLEIRTDENARPANPDGPHDHQQTRAIADGIHDAFRLLNYATMHPQGLQSPSDVYSVLGTLASAVSLLPQSLHQMSQWIGQEVAQGAARENPSYGPHCGNAEAAYAALAAVVREASGTATDLGRLLDKAQAQTRGLESARDT